MKQESKQKLANLIKELRADKSQRSLARSLGVSFASIQSWESGDAMPSVENLSLIAENAGFTLQGLIDYLEGRPNSKVVRLDEMIMQVKSMPQRDLAILNRAVGDRFMAIAESVG